MTEKEIAVAIAENKKEIGSLKHRMNGVENMTKSINNLALSVQELTLNMKHMLEHQKEHEERIDILEKKPANKWEKVEMTLIGGIVGAIVTALCSTFL